MLFVWRGSVVPQILPRLGFFFALSCGVVWARRQWGPLPLQLGAGPLGLLGIALAIFLGFRNSTSYERFWEARKLWGSLLIVLRSFVRQGVTVPTPALTQDERRYVIGWAVELTRSLNQQLRHESSGKTPERERFPTPFEQRIDGLAYKPAFAIRELAVWLHALRREGRISDILAASMEQNLDRLSEVVGGCERIAGTPIPYVYSVLLHRTVYLYCALLPFALVDVLGWSTPWMTLFVAYTFIALDSVTAELEDPFGVEPNDLPLDALTRTITRAVLELAEEPLPPALEPDAQFRLR
jgi:putative membrane protein